MTTKTEALVKAAMAAYARLCGYTDYDPAEFRDDMLARFVEAEAYAADGCASGLAQSFENMAQNFSDLADAVADSATE